MKITEDNKNDNVSEKFIFTQLGDASFFKNIFQKENMVLLEKWGLAQNTDLFKMRFNLQFDLKNLDRFLLDMFNDVTFRNTFTPIGQIAIPDNEKFIKNISFKKLGCKSANLDILDVMYENQLINKETGIACLL